jgi:zinc transport system substrate-binding protein
VQVIAALLVLVLALVSSACRDPGGKAGPTGAPTNSAVASSKAPAAAATPSPPAATGLLPATPDTVSPLAAGAPLKIGVTMHPYYSWVKNVAGDAKDVEVRPILPGEVDAGDYQPSPADIKKLSDLDALVVNGIGHDDFIGEMLKASGNTKVVVIHANDATPLMKQAHGDAVNSHTFISFTNAIQETYGIAKIMGALRPDLADTFQANAGAYAKRLRKIKADAAEKLADAKVHRVVTVHDGYGYFCQEFGIEVAGVVQPSHGLTPSAAELGEMVDLLKREKITVVLTEESFPEKMLDVLKSAGPVRVYIISHIAAGEYGASEFEDVMKRNADTLVKALVTDAG